MFCVKCGKELKEGVKFCTNCGEEVKTKIEGPIDNEKLVYSQENSGVTNGNTQAPNTTDGKATASLVLGIISIFIPCVAIITSIIGLILGITSKERSGKRTAGIIINSIVLAIILVLAIIGFTTGFLTGITSQKTTYKPSRIIENHDSDTIKTGEKFEFDDFEITIGPSYSFTKVDNSYSQYNNKDVIKLSVRIKNISNTSNHLNMFYYNMYGTTGDNLPKLSALFNESLDYASNLQPQESYTKYMYLLYDGDGKYKIEFNNYSEKKTVEIDIVK